MPNSRLSITLDTIREPHPVRNFNQRLPLHTGAGTQTRNLSGSHGSTTARLIFQ